MLLVLDHMIESHDLTLVFLAGAICVLACFTTMRMLGPIPALPPARAKFWLICASVAFGGGVWATHFIAMLAFETHFAFAFDIPLTVLSVAAAILISAAGFYIGTFKRRPFAGGLIAGVAIGVMHFVGMAALHVPAQLVWDFRYIAVSLVIGCLFAGWALHFNQGHKAPLTRQTSAFILAFSVCGLHFTAMAAITFLPDPTFEVSTGDIKPNLLAAIIAAVSFLILALNLLGSAVDQRFRARLALEAEVLRAHVQQLTATQLQLKKTSARLKEAVSAAEVANETKAAFLANMSHELRTPLNAIIGFSSVMTKESLGPIGSHKYKEYAGDIHNAAEHLLSLINDILDLSKIEAEKHELYEEDFDLNELIEEAVSLLRNKARDKSIDINTESQKNLPVVSADRTKINQVLINLLSNSIKFSDTGGKVDVRAAFCSRDGFTVEVTDTGMGIAPDDVERVLTPFARARNSEVAKQEGTGLGLSLSKSLVELHGGSLELESELGHGTTVTVTLPAWRSEQIAVA